MRRRLLVLIAAASALAVLTAYGEGSHAEDRAETVTYYGSFAGYDLPMKPIEEISKEEALSRDTYPIAWATNSGPRAPTRSVGRLRRYLGTPRRMNRSLSRSSTSSLFSFLATSIARHSRVCSSTIVSIRKARPSLVRSATKS